MQDIINSIREYSPFIIIGLVIIIVLFFILVMALISSVNKLETKYRKLMKGVSNKNLEELINSKIEAIDEAIEFSKEASSKYESLEGKIKSCVNKVSIIRYKAFEDVGSDLSFSVAILDSNDDGVLITSIYSRHDSTTYAKPIDKGISRYELSEEETQVLREAMNKS